MTEKKEGPREELRRLIMEANYVLRNAPLPDGKFSRFKKAVDRARLSLAEGDDDE